MESKYDPDNFLILLNLNTMIQLNPRDTNALKKRGILFYNNRIYEKAISDFKKYIQHMLCSVSDFKEIEDVYFLRGMSYFELEEFELSIDDFSILIDEESTSLGIESLKSCRCKRGEAFLKIGRKYDSFSDFSHPHQEKCLHCLKRCSRLCNELGRLSDACRYYSIILETFFTPRSPSNVDEEMMLREKLGKIFHLNREYERSIEQFSCVIDNLDNISGNRRFLKARILSLRGSSFHGLSMQKEEEYFRLKKRRGINDKIVLSQHVKFLGYDKVVKDYEDALICCEGFFWGELSDIYSKIIEVVENICFSFKSMNFEGETFDEIFKWALSSECRLVLKKNLKNRLKYLVKSNGFLSVLNTSNDRQIQEGLNTVKFEVEFYQFCLRVFPEKWELWYLMGRLKMGLGLHYREAARFFTRSIELHPLHLSSYHYRAKCYRKLFKLNNSIDDYCRLICLCRELKDEEKRCGKDIIGGILFQSDVVESLKSSIYKGSSCLESSIYEGSSCLESSIYEGSENEFSSELSENEFSSEEEDPKSKKEEVGIHTDCNNMENEKEKTTEEEGEGECSSDGSKEIIDENEVRNGYVDHSEYFDKWIIHYLQSKGECEKKLLESDSTFEEVLKTGSSQALKIPVAISSLLSLEESLHLKVLIFSIKIGISLKEDDQDQNRPKIMRELIHSDSSVEKTVEAMSNIITYNNIIFKSRNIEEMKGKLENYVGLKNAIYDKNLECIMNPNDVEYIFADHNKNSRSMRGNASKLLEYYKKNNLERYEAYYWLGRIFKFDGRNEEAIGELTEAIRILEDINPKDKDLFRLFECYYYRASSYRECGNIDCHMHDLERIIRWNPSFRDVMRKRGDLFFERGKFDLALDDYETCLEHHKKFIADFKNEEEPRSVNYSSSHVMNNIAICHFKLGKFGKALSLFNHARVIRSRLISDAANEYLMKVEKKDFDSGGLGKDVRVLIEILNRRYKIFDDTQLELVRLGDNHPFVNSLEDRLKYLEWIISPFCSMNVVYNVGVCYGLLEEGKDFVKDAGSILNPLNIKRVIKQEEEFSTTLLDSDRVYESFARFLRLLIVHNKAFLKEPKISRWELFFVSIISLVLSVWGRLDHEKLKKTDFSFMNRIDVSMAMKVIDLFARWTFGFGKDWKEDLKRILLAEKKTWFPFMKDLRLCEREEEEEYKFLKGHFGMKNFEDFVVFRAIGRGCVGLTYLCRVQGVESIFNNFNRLFDRDYWVDQLVTGVLVMKLFIDQTDSERKDVMMKENLVIPYHRNVVMIVSSKSNQTIDFSKLPSKEKPQDDFLSQLSDEDGSLIEFLEKVVSESRQSNSSESSDTSEFEGMKKGEGGMMIMKYHKTDLVSYLKLRKKDNKPLLDLEMGYILQGILSGVFHLHQNLIVHRDLHPGNVFVDPVNGRVLVGDFSYILDLRGKEAISAVMVKEDGEEGEETDPYQIKMKENLFLVHKDDEIMFTGSSGFREFSVGGARDHLPPEIADFDCSSDVVIDYSKCDVYSVGVIAYFMISCFSNGFDFDDPVSIERSSRNFDHIAIVDRRLLDLIWKLLDENAATRIGVHDAVVEMTEIVKELEKNFKPFKRVQNKNSEGNNDKKIDVEVEETEGEGED